jgi:hypothetical protein
MAAEASDPELSGIDAAENTTPNILVYPVVCRSTSSRGGRHLARRTRSSGAVSLFGLPGLKSLQTGRDADAQQRCGLATARMAERPLRRPSDCPTVSVR